MSQIAMMEALAVSNCDRTKCALLPCKTLTPSISLCLKQRHSQPDESIFGVLNQMLCNFAGVLERTIAGMCLRYFKDYNVENAVYRQLTKCLRHHLNRLSLKNSPY